MAGQKLKTHLKFSSGEQKKFISKILGRKNVTIYNLAKLVKVTPRTIRDWKREKFNISLEAAQLFCERYYFDFPGNKEELIKKWERARRDFGRKGGLTYFKKYGNPATKEGSKKGGAKTLAILREKGIIPPVKIYSCPSRYTNDLAEFVGLVLGDGGITSGQLCITLNSEKDTELAKFVIDLGERLFGEKPRVLKERKCKAFRIYYNGESLVRYLLKIGLKTGNKVRQQVGVPEWIKKSKKFRISCLRGLMDTDGGVFIHRYRINEKLYSYKKICFSNRSLPILNFVYETLKGLGLNPVLRAEVENKQVWLYNCNEAARYLKIVGTRNPRLRKYNIL